jgi:hypothetical protein
MNGENSAARRKVVKKYGILRRQRMESGRVMTPKQDSTSSV